LAEYEVEVICHAVPYPSRRGTLASSLVLR
jgi:hypothetical protein